MTLTSSSLPPRTAARRCDLRNLRRLLAVVEHPHEQALRRESDGYLTHNSTGDPTNLGVVQDQLGELEPARVTLQRALAIKQAAGKASWSGFRDQVQHLRWVDSLGATAVWLEGIAEARIADFAGEAMAADAGVMRDVAPLKRLALLACVVHVARTRARDDLAEMFCKRMGQVTKLAKAELAEIREHQAEMSERLITNYRSVLGCLDPRNSEAPDAAAALRMARRTVADAGGFEAQLANIEAVAAHHANNYMPLVAKH
ncbi:MAG: hypothetical protein LC790_04055, partial [Actinobacteria bacterium]|nr:hypothetical protein [Actinomycetota bacterium]